MVLRQQLGPFLLAKTSTIHGDRNAYLLYGVDAPSDNQARDYLAAAAFAFAFASLVLTEGREARLVLKQVEAFYSKTVGHTLLGCKILDSKGNDTPSTYDQHRFLACPFEE